MIMNAVLSKQLILFVYISKDQPVYFQQFVIKKTIYI